MIRLENLSHWFFRGTPNEVRALDDLSLQVPPGQFITLIGSNGAGKSTLLKTIGGRIIPDEGVVWLNDVDVTDWPEHRRAALVGHVDQNPMASTAPALTVEENLALALLRGKARGLGTSVSQGRRATFREALHDVGLGLEERLGAEVGNLSGGQRQALSLVMAALVRPRLLLLDEHTAALDPKAAALVLDITERLVRTHGLTTLMVTHNMEQAIRHGDRLLMLHQGRIVLDVSGAEKQSLTVVALVERFHRAAGDTFADDRAVLT